MALSPYAPICFTAAKACASEKGAGALILGKILPIGIASIALYNIFFIQSMRFMVIAIVWYVVSAILAGEFGKRVDSDSCQPTAVLLLRCQHDKGETCREMTG